MGVVGCFHSKLLEPGRPTKLADSRARAYCAYTRCGWGCSDIFSLVYNFSFFWETTRYRLKYCLKGPLNPKQPAKQPTSTCLHWPLSSKTSKFPYRFEIELLIGYPIKGFVQEAFVYGEKTSHLEISTNQVHSSIEIAFDSSSSFSSSLSLLLALSLSLIS